MSESLRIIFAGTPDFAARHLDALLSSGHNIVGVFTQPDRPAGRGKKLIKGDADLAVIAHYLNRGHSLEELLGMTFLERMFLLAAWELEVDALNGQ